MGYDSRPTYSDAVAAAANCIAEAKQFMRVHDSVIVLVAGIIATTYDLETRDVMLDIRKSGEVSE